MLTMLSASIQQFLAPHGKVFTGDLQGSMQEQATGMGPFPVPSESLKKAEMLNIAKCEGARASLTCQRYR